jgi:hypothetical protein
MSVLPLLQELPEAGARMRVRTKTGMESRTKSRVRAILLLFLACTLVVSVVVLVAAEGHGRAARQAMEEPLLPLADAVVDDEPIAADAVDDEPRAREPEGGPTTQTAPFVLPDAYRGSSRVVGIVQLHDATAVPGAEVVCRPYTLGPRRPEEFAALSTRTDAGGFFYFGLHPDAVRYKITAYTASHWGEVDSLRDEATGGHLVVTISPLYYTRYEFLDENGQPVPLPRAARVLSPGRRIWSSYFPRRPLTEWFQKRIGIQFPTEKHEVVVVFRARRKRTLSASRVLHLPGYRPVRVSMERRPLSEWPAGDTIRLERDPDDARVLWEVQFPAPSWPSGWGTWNRLQDYRIWFLRRGIYDYRTVNRYTPAFVWPPDWPPDEPFILLDQNRRELTYRVEQKGRKRIVRPDYPPYGYLRVTYPRMPDVTKHYDVTLQSKDSPDWYSILGFSCFPGMTYFGPLAAGEYKVKLQRFVAGMSSAKKLVRDLGTVFVREGPNVYCCE